MKAVFNGCQNCKACWKKMSLCVHRGVDLCKILCMPTYVYAILCSLYCTRVYAWMFVCLNFQYTFADFFSCELFYACVYNLLHFFLFPNSILHVHQTNFSSSLVFFIQSQNLFNFNFFHIQRNSSTNGSWAIFGFWCCYSLVHAADVQFLTIFTKKSTTFSAGILSKDRPNKIVRATIQVTAQRRSRKHCSSSSKK